MFDTLKTPSRLSFIKVLIGFIHLLPRIHIMVWYCYKIHQLTRKKNGGWATIFQKNSNHYPDRIAIKSEDGVFLTYKEFNKLVNQYAYVFSQNGIRCGDIVQVILQNRPELLITVAALAKIGAISAMTNPSLKGQFLEDYLQCSNAESVVLGEESTDNYPFSSSRKNRFFIRDKGKLSVPETFCDVCNEAQNALGTEPPSLLMKLSSPAIYVPTSGTTGNKPKYAIITHKRILMSALWFGKVTTSIGPKDTMYCPLPLFHVFSLIVGWQMALINGCAFAMRRKFSVTEFRSDILQFKATILIYVGELLSYLMRSESEEDVFKSTLTTIVGNGLRNELYYPVKRKYRLRRIVEMYGASESELVFTNILNLPSTAGVSLQPHAIVAYEPETSLPCRSANGYAHCVPVGQNGLLLCKITRRYPFYGYTDEFSTNNKIFESVFKNGDRWFNTGDIVMDIGYGHIRFIDRVSGSYRYQGENVLTKSVETVVNRYSAIETSVCYSVKIKGIDGRVGVVGLVIKDNELEIDFNEFTSYMINKLPTYAIPGFIRIIKSIPVSETFKYPLHLFEEEGIDPEKIADPLFIYDRDRSTYVKLTCFIYHELIGGNLRV
jgi:acyl-CoA synthetase (AMP-forming)/AMP-acid ligase II